jgi:hypothetical protein
MSETNACAVCSWIPRKHSGKLYAQEVSYVKDIVPYKKHRYQYSTCQANDGSLLGPCVLAIGGILPCITTHIHTDTHTRGDWHMDVVGTYHRL